MRKSFSVAPGIRLNVSNRGVGASFGGRGMRYSVHSSGRRTTTVGIPGSGLSYVTTNGKRYKSSPYQRQIALQNKQEQKLQEIEQNQIEVDLFKNQIELIHSIHKEADEPIDWNEVRNRPSPFQIGQKGFHEKEAIQKAASYQPGIFAKILNKDEKTRTELNLAIEEAKKLDQQEYTTWEEMNALAKRILNGHTDAYIEVIKDMDPFEDLLAFGSEFDVSTHSSRKLEVSYDVLTEGVVPTQIKSLTKTGKLSTKDMPKSKYFDYVQDYVCSCAIRIARDAFSLLPLNQVLVHVNEKRMNPSNGHEELVTILSVLIDRDRLLTLNLDQIDCSDSMQNFRHEMKFLKTKGFMPVQPLRWS